MGGAVALCLLLHYMDSVDAYSWLPPLAGVVSFGAPLVVRGVMETPGNAIGSVLNDQLRSGPALSAASASLKDAAVLCKYIDYHLLKCRLAHVCPCNCTLT